MRRLLLGSLLLVALAAGAASVVVWQLLHQPYRGFADDSVRVSVPAGAPAAAILEQLVERGVVRHALLARLYLTWFLDDPPLKAGEYHFDRPLAVPQVLDLLVRGQVVTHPVTLVEGLTLEETARALADAGFGDYELFRAEMSRPERIAALDPRAPDLEGYLFPDTYRFARGTGEAAIVDTLVQTFERRYRDALGAAGRSPGETDTRALVTLASIVEKEAARDDERATIAGVYANRLEIGMPLQADPTVIFALRLAGTWDGNLRRPDLQHDSPYNTYRYPGLPPGPIASPGAASLRAAAAPAEVPYLFFVSRNDGSHVFARTLAEHNRNVERWQKEYWRRRWAEERRMREAGVD
ncbi:MAG: endolytic transglycosylase MltG [Thermoanaerobaculia bacterium]|nr:endolytic transglycosylase MltG [Thermoanaerobaculia bacterium]